MVIDANVWVSALIEHEAQHEASRSWLAYQSHAGEVLVIPTLALPEVAGAVSRQTGQSSAGRRAADNLRQMSNLLVVPVDNSLALEAARIAADQRLHGADAVYVAVASALG